MNLRKQFKKETGKKAPFHGDYHPYGNSYGFACAERDYYRFYTKWLEAKVPQWISVDERLPEELQSVLCLNQFGGQWIEQFYKTWEKETPAHWMPLPEPEESK